MITRIFSQPSSVEKPVSFHLLHEMQVLIWLGGVTGKKLNDQGYDYRRRHHVQTSSGSKPDATGTGGGEGKAVSRELKRAKREATITINCRTVFPVVHMSNA
jgi:hypothetical protein